MGILTTLVEVQFVRFSRGQDGTCVVPVWRCLAVAFQARPSDSTWPGLKRATIPSAHHQLLRT